MENQKIKKSAGRLSPTPMGDYDDTTTYRRLDWVYYGGTTYICKKNNTLGIKPSDPERWQKIIDEIAEKRPDAQIWITFFGEGVILKDLPEKIAYAREKGLNDYNVPYRVDTTRQRDYKI